MDLVEEKSLVAWPLEVIAQSFAGLLIFCFVFSIAAVMGVLGVTAVSLGSSASWLTLALSAIGVVVVGILAIVGSTIAVVAIVQSLNSGSMFLSITAMLVVVSVGVGSAVYNTVRAWYALRMYQALWLEHIPALALSAWLTIILARGIYTNLSADAVQRVVLKWCRPTKIVSWEAVLRTVGVPEVVQFYAKRRLATVLLFVVNGIGLSIVPTILWADAGSVAGFVSTLEYVCGNKLRDAMCVHRLMAWRPVMYVAVAIIVAVVLWLARASRRKAIEYARISLDDLSRADRRPPIVFLRNFDRDALVPRKPKHGLLGKLLAFGRAAPNLDQLLLLEGTPYGPVVAIGDPKDEHAPYGAARGYFSDDAWKAAVEGLVARSKFVVLELENSVGVMWELEHVVRVRALRKTLLLTPGGLPTDEWIRALEAGGGEAAVLASVLRDVGGSGCYALGFGYSGVPYVFRSSTRSLLATQLLLRWCMRTLPGADFAIDDKAFFDLRYQFDIETGGDK